MLPPRHGKSELSSKYLSAWYLGTFPDRRVILASYEAQFAASWGRKAREVLERNAAGFGVEVSGKSSAADWWETTAGGAMMTTGVGGPATGKGANLFIIDDPVKNPLAIDTPIPTPDGWKLMGELVVGDCVYDHAGQPTKVTRISEPYREKRWRVRFSDGSFVDCHPDHQWAVFDRHTHGIYTIDHKDYGDNWWRWRKFCRAHTGRPGGVVSPRVLTVRQLAERVRCPKRGMRNWTIPNAMPLELPERDLLVDPYLLGLWLGDGSKAANRITANKDDADYYDAEIRKMGLFPRILMQSAKAQIGSPDTRVMAVSVRDGGDSTSRKADTFQKRLRGLGVIDNKHVPPEYLRASSGQRLALLRGLMDTDGTAGEQAAFCNTNERLVDAVVELAVSLGGKATKSAKENSHGVYWLVTLCTPFCPFALPRKQESWRRLGGKPSIRRMNRTIEAIEVLDEETDHVCITVDAPSHLFLAGRGMVPTHNSEEALSPTYRQRADDWYESVATTRLEPDGTIILIMTRWDDDDLAGRRIKKGGWEVVKLPALARERDPLGRQPGEALWPARYNEAALDSIRSEVGEKWWAALYDQEPFPEGGNLFKPDRMSWYEDLGDGYRLQNGTVWPYGHCHRFAVVDPSVGKKTDADPTAMGVFAQTPDDFLLVLDMVSERIPIPQLVPRLDGLCRKWGAEYAAVEANGFQIQVVREIKDKTRLVIREVHPHGKSKLVRAFPAIVRMEAGALALPRGEAAWKGEYIGELARWTGDERELDNQVDVTAYAVREMVQGKNIFPDKAIDAQPRVAREAHDESRLEPTHEVEDRWRRRRLFGYGRN